MVSFLPDACNPVGCPISATGCCPDTNACCPHLIAIDSAIDLCCPIDVLVTTVQIEVAVVPNPVAEIRMNFVAEMTSLFHVNASNFVHRMPYAKAVNRLCLPMCSWIQLFLTR